MSNKHKDRIDNKSPLPTSQQTSGPKEEVVGRVNNESDENAGLETASHVEEIGVVSNEKKTIRIIGKQLLCCILYGCFVLLNISDTWTALRSLPHAP